MEVINEQELTLMCDPDAEMEGEGGGVERERDGGGNPKSDHVDKICQFVQTDLQKEAAKNEMRKQGGSVKLCQAKTGEAGKKQDQAQ